MAMPLNVIAGHDEMDSTSATMEKKDYTKALVQDVKEMKIGLPKEFFRDGVDQEVKESIQRVAKNFEKLGAKIVECSLPGTEHALPAYYVIVDAEASANLGRFDGIRYGHRTSHYESIRDIYRNSRSEGFGEEVKRRIMLGTYVLSAGYYDAYYKKAQKVRTVIKNSFAKALEEVDILLTPTSPITAFDIGSKSKNPMELYMADILTVPINMAGVPAISIPGEKDHEGLPIGIQLIGKHFDEETIIRAAYTYEQNFGEKEEA